MKTTSSRTNEQNDEVGVSRAWMLVIGILIAALGVLIFIFPGLIVWIFFVVLLAIGAMLIIFAIISGGGKKKRK